MSYEDINAFLKEQLDKRMKEIDQQIRDMCIPYDPKYCIPNPSQEELEALGTCPMCNETFTLNCYGGHLDGWGQTRLPNEEENYRMSEALHAKMDAKFKEINARGAVGED